MPSKEKKKELYIAKNMAELQKKSEVKPTTTNARILVRSADTMFREAETLDSQGDEEKAFIMYMRYFNIVKQVRLNADYKKNKQYYDNLLGQKNQVRAIEQAEKLSESLKERYDFKEAEAVAKKFAALEATSKPQEKRQSSQTEDDNKDQSSQKEGKKGEQIKNGTKDDGNSSKEEASTSSKNEAMRPLITPTALCELLRDSSTQLIIMDARSSADFTESHIQHSACISVPQEILPPGTTVTRIESHLPEESRSLWKQRGNVDYIILLDWCSTIDALVIGTTLRTLKDALFKYDSTVIIKSEPLLLEGGYDQWLLFYPTMTTNSRVSRPSVPNTSSLISLLEFDYPDFEEPQITKAPVSSDIVIQSPSQDKIVNPPGSVPQFNRALKPRTVDVSITDFISKSTDLNNVWNPNLVQASPKEDSPTILSSSLYPNIIADIKVPKKINIVSVAKKPEKNTNVAADKARNTEEHSHMDKAAPAAVESQDSFYQEEEEQKARLQDLVNKRKKEEKALADIMRKRRQMEKDLKETERLVEQEKQAKEARDKAVMEEEAERQRQAEVEKLRQERKRKEEREKQRQNNLAKEKELAEAKERERQEMEEKLAAQQAAAQHAEFLIRQEQEQKAQLEAEKQAQKKYDDEKQAAASQHKEEKTAKQEDTTKTKRLQEDTSKTKRLQEDTSKTKKLQEEQQRREEKEKLEVTDHTEIRKAQEPKMIPAPSLPSGWEKRLDRATGRYYYIDHNHSKTQWEPPSMTKRPVHKGIYTVKLKEEPAKTSKGLSRSHSSPDIMKQMADEAKIKSMPIYDRTSKPSDVEAISTRVPAVPQVARRRDLNPLYGNVGSALTGLRNLGNTCYMNSTIQCLINTTPLVSYFLNDSYLNHINRDSEQGMHGEVVDEFAVVVKALWSGQYRCITPRDLKYTIGEYNPMFAGYQQQDSQEFLTFLLDGLHEGLNEVKVRPHIPEQDNDDLPDDKAAKIAWENHKRLHRSVIVELFQGQLKSTLSCRTCHKKSVTFQAFMYISLPIPSSSKCSLRDCFRAFMQPEMMTGSCKWKCPKCRVERDAEKKIDIWKLPYILLIGLNRFVNDGMWMQKKTTFVDFPIKDLDLEEFTLGPRHNARYSLYGVSNHYGTMEGGHYTSFCRNPCNGLWHKFDDHEVYDMPVSEIKTSAAFVLYYTSIELNAPKFKLQF